MENVVVTFHNVKSGQKVIVTLGHDEEKEELDLNVRLDPIPNENETLGLVGLLSELFINKLNEYGKYDDGSSDSNESDSR